MVWNDLKYDLENVHRPKTKRGLIRAIKTFWTNRVSVDYCNKKIDKLYQVVRDCIILRGRATGY